MLPEIDPTILQNFDTNGAPELFLAARVLFGGTLAFMGMNHFMQLDSMTEYAGYKGLPAPKLMVVASGALLILGSLGIILGVAPVIAGAGLAAFLLIGAVTMHDFWAVPAEDKETEMTQFLKNIALTGGALAFAALGTTGWEYALAIGLF